VTIRPLYEDSPSTAVSEALRLYRIGHECSRALKIGLSLRQLCVMTGLSLSALEETLKVVELYPDDEMFLKAFQSHDIVIGAPHRTWSTFLMSIGVNTISPKEAEQILASIKQYVQRITIVAHGTADPEVAHKTLGSLRSWLIGRVPTTIWSTIDRNFFKYQRCSWCSSEANDPELVEINGMLVTKCNQCKSEGVGYSTINWETVAAAYAAYAFECNNAAEVYRTI